MSNKNNNNKKWDLTNKLIFKIETMSESEGDFITDLRKEMLVVIAKKLDKRIKEEVTNFCKAVEIPHAIIDGTDEDNKFREYQKAYHEFEPQATLIVGNVSQFPGNYYRTHLGKHFSDNVFQDPEKSGKFTTPVGRVSGDVSTIMYHLLLRTGDTDKAVVFLPEYSVDNELAVKGIEELGFEYEIIKDWSADKKEILEDTEAIFQYCNSDRENYAMHGTQSGWITKLKTIFDAKDLLEINFKNYPIVFSQACNTGNFGTFAQQMLRSKACFLGSSSPTYTFKQVDFTDWWNVPSSDGWKIGFLDLMDSKRNIGEVKIEIENKFVDVLERSSYDYLQQFKEDKVHVFNPVHAPIIASIQFQLFGNPLRFATVGMKPDFDIEVSN